MNIRRGFFRMWIIASVCWVAIIAGVTYLALAEQHGTAASQQACADARIANPKLGNPYDCFSRFSSSDDPLSTGSLVARLVGFAVGPPVVVFGLGLVVLWVGRGFRAK